MKNKPEANKKRRPTTVGSGRLVVPLTRRAKIRRTDLWRGYSGKIYRVEEYEVGKTVGELYKSISQTYCTYMRKRHNDGAMPRAVNNQKL